MRPLWRRCIRCLINQFPDHAHHFRSLDVHYLLDHPFVVAACHGIGYFGGEKANTGIARLSPGALEAGILPEAGVEQGDERFAVLSRTEQVQLIGLHGHRPMVGAPAPNGGEGGWGEWERDPYDSGEYVGHQPVRAEAEALLLHVLEDLERDLPDVRADDAGAVGERARAFLAPARLDERHRRAAADDGHGLRSPPPIQ